MKKLRCSLVSENVRLNWFSEQPEPYQKWRKREMEVNLPTLGVILLNSKFVSKPCKHLCFCYKLDPMHYQNFIEHNFRHCKLYIRVHTRIAHTCTNRRYCIQVCTQHFWPNKDRKKTNKTITKFLCLIFKDKKDWLTHKKNHFKKFKTTFNCVNSLLVWKTLGSAYIQFVYIHNVIELLRLLVSMYSSSCSGDKENTTNMVNKYVIFLLGLV